MMQDMVAGRGGRGVVSAGAPRMMGWDAWGSRGLIKWPRVVVGYATAASKSGTSSTRRDDAGSTRQRRASAARRNSGGHILRPALHDHVVEQGHRRWAIPWPVGATLVIYVMQPGCIRVSTR